MTEPTPAIASRHSLVLDILARLERPVLKLNFRVVRSPWMRYAPVRWLVGRLFLAPLSRFGAVGQPLTLDEAEGAVRAAGAAGALALGPCGCRHTHHGCNHPVLTEILVYAGVTSWTSAFPAEFRPASPDEIVGILRRCRDLGMLQMLWRSGMGDGSAYAICNCCSDGCVPLLNRRVYPAYRYHAGHMIVSREPGRCSGCGLCSESCSFGAHPVEHAGDVPDCLGCGLCSERCPTGALSMRTRDATPARAETVST